MRPDVRGPAALGARGGRSTLAVVLATCLGIGLLMVPAAGHARSLPDESEWRADVRDSDDVEWDVELDADFEVLRKNRDQ